MANFNFWKKYLIVVSYILIGMGIYVAYLKNTPVFKLFSQFVDPTFWPNHEINEGTIRFKSFSYSLFGIFMILWGIFTLFIAKFAFDKENKWTWNCILITTIVWFCTMFPYSIYYKFYINAISDVILFLMFILPLIFTRKQFR